MHSLQKQIQDKTAVYAVIGLGYVGLPNLVFYGEQGYRMLGFEMDPAKVASINRGVSYIQTISSERLSGLREVGRISATSDMVRLGEADVIFIDVPTPIDEFKAPDTAALKRACASVRAYVGKGSLIILESTTYPTTTEEFFVKAFEEKGWRVGRDIFIAYSPERIDPGNQNFTIENTPRIVGGYTQNCLELAKLVLGEAAYPMSSVRAAEMAKLYENTFRFVNIALANEMAQLCNKIGIDFWEVVTAADTKPFGFMAFYPTVGVGGHCIPVDPYYLTWYAKKHHFTAELIEAAGAINDRMNDYAIAKLSSILNDHQKTVLSSKIAVMGVTYKKDVPDVRESAIFRLYEALDQMGADITLYDPFVERIMIGGKKIPVYQPDYDALSSFDLVVILVDHSLFDYARIAEQATLIFDTKNRVEVLKGAVVSRGEESQYKL